MSIGTAPPANLEVAPHRFTMERIRLYGSVTSDMNPLHVDPAFAATTRFGAPIVHGMFVLAPAWDAFERAFGPAAVVEADADIRFSAPIFVDTVPVYRVTLETAEAGRAQYAVEIADAAGTVAITASIGIAVHDR